jgi:uncharacterized protein (TIGR02246 family)
MISDGDKAAIAALTQKVVAAWAYHDADTFASVFTDDGTMILPGVFSDGRDEVRTHMEKAFREQYKGTQVTGKPISIRSLGTDTAILLSNGGILMPGETEVTENSAIRASWLVVRQNQQWRLAAYQNTPRTDAAATGGDGRAP